MIEKKSTRINLALIIDAGRPLGALFAAATRSRNASCFTAALLAALIISGQIVSGQETLDTYKFSRDSQQGKKINPVPLNLQGKNPDLVYLGSYIVNAQASCNSCHTCPSYRGVDPHTVGGSGLGPPDSAGPVNAANFLAGGTPFPGRGAPSQGSSPIAANLTPDSSGRPGGLTFDDFKSAMLNGTVSGKPGHILQVMPWPVYRKMYDNDLAAIYQYLSSIPSAQPGTCAGPGQSGN